MVAEHRRVMYLAHMVDVPGWYWSERSGNRIIYTGPFRTEAEAKKDCFGEGSHD